MTTNEMTLIRMAADAVVKDGRYAVERLMGGKWLVVIFDITKERAEQYASYYSNARVVEMTK